MAIPEKREDFDMIALTRRGLNTRRTELGRVECQYTLLSLPLTGGVAMSVQAISWVIDKSKQKGNQFVVLLMIANHARSDGTGAWPSVSTLARECRLSERTVQRSIQLLVKNGELSVQVRKGPYGSNLYTVRGCQIDTGGVTTGQRGCQIDTFRGDRAVSPNPSLTVHKDNQGNFYELSVDGVRRILGPAEVEARGIKEWK